MISKDLKDGMQSQETIFWDDKIKPKLKMKIDEAQAQLDKANDAPQKQNRLKITTANRS